MRRFRKNNKVIKLKVKINIMIVIKHKKMKKKVNSRKLNNKQIK